MPRKRRNAEEARREILEAAHALLIEEGPDALKVARIAKRAKISHPLILHHFGSTEGLVQSLQEKVARDIRDNLLNTMQEIPLRDGLQQAFVSLSARENARSMAWLIARGHSPFPPAEEQGLRHIQELLHLKTGRDRKELGHMILLILFSMYGEGLFGEELRKRLGVLHTEDNKQEFQHWLLSLLEPR